MKKMFLMLFATISMAVAFTSCENPDDPTPYCWKITHEATFFGQTVYVEREVILTVAEKQQLEKDGFYDALIIEGRIISIKKQSLDDCMDD